MCNMRVKVSTEYITAPHGQGLTTTTTNKHSVAFLVPGGRAQCQCSLTRSGVAAELEPDTGVSNSRFNPLHSRNRQHFPTKNTTTERPQFSSPSTLPCIPQQLLAVSFRESKLDREQNYDFWRVFFKKWKAITWIAVFFKFPSRNTIVSIPKMRLNIERSPHNLPHKGKQVNRKIK